jgi:DNA-binding IclR family transcriptional regulator
MPTHPESVRSSGTQTIHRAAAVLRLLAANNRSGLRLVEVTKAMALEHSTVHRMLHGLIAEGLVAQDRSTRRYFLGPGLYELGLAAAPRLQLRDVCQRHLRSVAEQTGDTVFLIARSGFDGICLDRLEGAFPIKAMVLHVGGRRPLNIGAGGIAILSALPDAEIASICAVNSERVAKAFPRYSDRTLRKRIANARMKGYVENEIAEADIARSVSVAVRDRNGTTLGAISVTAIRSRLEGKRVEEVARLLSKAAQDIVSDRELLQA